MLDLIFNAIGAVVVATLGAARLAPITGAIRSRLEARAREGA
jgi:hypothetical protein